MSYEQGFNNGQKFGIGLGAAIERERILQDVEKLRPYTNDKQQVYFATFEAIIAAIKGVSK